jgi:hypothetical protein
LSLLQEGFLVLQVRLTEGLPVFNPTFQLTGLTRREDELERGGREEGRTEGEAALTDYTRRDEGG